MMRKTLKVLLLLISFLHVIPAITFTELAETPFTQCFAVNMKFGATMLPPQASLPPTLNSTCHGAAVILIGVPPEIFSCAYNPLHVRINAKMNKDIFFIVFGI